VRDRRRARRRWVLGLSACAAMLAASVAVAPMVAGNQPGSTDLSFLNVVEGGVVDHAGDHLAATPEATARAAARLRYCDQDAWRADHEAFCPEAAPPAREARTIQAAGLTQSPLATTEADGSWGPLLHIPTNAIHAVLMNNGKVLWFSQPKYPAENEDTVGGTAHVWDPATGISTSVPPPSLTYPVTGTGGGTALRPANLWCAGQTLLADGRVLVVGGNLEYPDNGGNGAGNGFKGAPWVMTFNPADNTWTRYADMPHGRWYPTLTELPDGRVLVVGGWDETGGVVNNPPGGPPLMIDNQDVEVFDPALATGPGAAATTVVSELPPNGPGQPTQFPDHVGLGLYPHMFVLPSTTTLGAGGHRVLVAGPTRYDSAVIDTANWVWTDVISQHPDTGQARLSQDRSWGTGWLAPSDTNGSTSVVLLGGADSGAPAPGTGTGTAPPAVGTSETLDLNKAIADPTSGWKLGVSPDLNIGRGHFNTTLLPDGSIFSNGGGYGRKNDSLYADPVYQSELMTPGCPWRLVGSEDDARTYHSTALLLPDGTVVSAGDDRDIAPPDTAGHIPFANRTAQIYSPPYLFAGPRPTIASAPAAVKYDAPFTVTVGGDVSAITRAVLVRPGAVTHANNMSQRVIQLPLVAHTDGLAVRSPLDATVAPPGDYMLFVQNAAGAMSMARWVEIDLTAPATVGPIGGVVASQTGTVIPCAASPPPTTTPTPPMIGPVDRTPPRATLTAAKARVRGRAVTLRLRLRSSERGTVRVTVARVGRGSKLTLKRPWRSPVALVAARTRWLVVTGRLGGGVAPRRLRVTLRVADRAGNARRLVRVLSLVRLPRP
jgi:hypothetical protein